MNETIILIKAKGDEKWSIQPAENVQIGFFHLVDFWDIEPDTEYIEFKPCCCIVNRIIRLKDIEKYGLKKEDISEEMIIR